MNGARREKGAAAMRWAAYAILALPAALTVTGVIPTALAALLVWLLEPLGGWALVICLAAFFGLAWLLLDAVM